MGEYREPLCAGARWLLARGHASPGDTHEWIRLERDHLLELHTEGEEVLKATALPEPR